MPNVSQQTRLKQERVIEAVRRGLEGAPAVEFMHNEGFATTQAGIARQLRALGGRGAISALIEQGLDNIAIMRHCFPDFDVDDVAFPSEPAEQADMFPDLTPSYHGEGDEGTALFDTVKMTLRMPADLHEAIKLAARAESKKQNDLIVEILTAYLSRRPFR